MMSDDNEPKTSIASVEMMSHPRPSDPVSIASCRDRLQAIRDMAAYDEEIAHAKEDALHQDVLSAVAAGHPDSVELARIALETTTLEFPRFYA